MTIDSAVQASFDTQALSAKWDRKPEGVLVEKHETIIYANKRYASLLGYKSAADLIGKHVSIVIAPGDMVRMLAYGRRRILGARVPSAYNFRARQKDGAPVPLNARVSSEPELSLITTIVSRASAAIVSREVLFRDEEGFERFYTEHAGRAFAILLRMLRDEHNAQDVLQESFLQAWRQHSRYDVDRGSPAAWINTIVRSRALDHLRASRSTLPTAIEEASTPDPIAEQNVTSGIERTRLRELLAQLPSPQRIAMELAYFEGYSQTEIAAQLDVPLGTVKTRILLGMQRLRSYIAAPSQPHAPESSLPLQGRQGMSS